MIQTILLDLGGVIVGLDFDRAYRAAEKLSPYTAQEIPRRISEHKLAEPYETGRFSTEEFYRRFTAALEMDVCFEAFCEIWQDMFADESLLDAAFLESLARQRRLLLLSNTNELHFEFLRARFPILEHFHDYVLSYKVGSMKPDAGIYDEAVRRAGCRPEECFFADDKPENIVGARRRGLDAVVFEGAESLKQQLTIRGIVV